MAYTTINKGSDYFNTKLYTGTGATQSITGVGFQPDFTWIKDRDSTNHNRLQDSVRGVKKSLKSDGSDTEATFDSNNGMASFDSDGFTLTQDSSNFGFNGSGSSQVSWNWLAGGTASSNTDGSITSQVSANTTSGFSIVSYTGTGSNATVGHGLGVAPKMVMIKNRTTAAQNWTCYHSALGGTQGIRLNTTAAAFTDSTRFNDTDPTSSVFSIGTATDVNTSSASIIAYCFAEKKGYSNLGSYTGNGSTNGTFVYTGFKPAWLLIKRTSGTDQWILYDTKRETSNVMNLALTPESNGAEQDTSTFNTVDIVSNGFKCRGGSSGSGTATNQSGGSYIYMAFAENPFVTSTGIPATAR